jgi:hypothetical protein
MDLRKAMRRGVPLVLLGAAATVVLRKRLHPLPALPPGHTSAGPAAQTAADPSAAIAEHSAAVVATAALAEPLPDAAPASPPVQGAPDALRAVAHAGAGHAAGSTTAADGRFARRLRRAPVDIVTVVDDQLGAVR